MYFYCKTLIHNSLERLTAGLALFPITRNASREARKQISRTASGPRQGAALHAKAAQKRICSKVSFARGTDFLIAVGVQHLGPRKGRVNSGTGERSSVRIAALEDDE